jgi:sialidase-1
MRPGGCMGTMPRHALALLLLLLHAAHCADTCDHWRQQTISAAGRGLPHTTTQHQGAPQQSSSNRRRTKTDDDESDESAPRIVRRTEVFAQRTGGYMTYRIPSLVAGSDGASMIALAEGRAPQGRGAPVGNESVCWGQLASLFDWQCYMKDIVLRRSVDGGQAFGPVQVVAASNSSVLYTNPLGLLDEHTRNLWLAYVRCPIPPGAPPGRSVFRNCTQLVRTSLDGGVSWSPEHEVEGSFPQDDGGVGSGLQLESGRLIFPRNGKGMLISDTHGESWRLGEALPHHGESQAMQLVNGSVIMQMRDQDHRYDYVWCRSDDGGSSFMSPCAVRSAPLVPDVPTSILRRRGSSTLLFSHPNSNVTPCPLGRRNMTISANRDGDGDSWSDVLQVFTGPAAYSSLAALGGGRVGLLYEKSMDGKEPIDFEAIELAIIEGLPA